MPLSSRRRVLARPSRERPPCERVFSARSAHDPTPNVLARALAARMARGEPVLDLTVTNPSAVGLTYPPDLIAGAFAAGDASRYVPDPRGPEEARELGARLLGLPEDKVYVTASTSESYAHLLTILADPGDEVLVPRPSYPLLEWLARFAGVGLRSYDLLPEDDFHVDLSSVREGIGAGARAIFAVSPNHPTGTYLGEAEEDALLATGAPLVVDEVFRTFPVEAPAKGTRRVPGGLVFRLSGLSKHAALPQLKVGFVGIDGDAERVRLAAERLELVLDTFLSVSTPSALAAPRLEAASGALRTAVTSRCRANLAALDRALAGTALSRFRVRAGQCVLVRMPATATDLEHAVALLERGVLVQPGHYYDLARPTVCVLSLLPREDVFAEGVGRLGDYARDVCR